MLDAKKMPHRGHIINSWKLQDNLLIIDTIRHSGSEIIAGVIELTPLKDDLIRIRMVEGQEFLASTSLSVVNSLQDSNVKIKVIETEKALELITAKLKLSISKDYCAISYYNLNGELILQENPAGSREFERIDIMQPVYEQDNQITVDNSIDGLKFRSNGVNKVKVRDGFRAKLELSLSDDEAIYGLGQHEEGIFNYRNHYQFLYQENMKIAMPVLLSTKGYGLFWDTLSLSTFDDTNEVTTISIDACDALEYYFMYGPEFDQIIGNIRYLTGKLPMLPKWSYGYLQSKERYETAEELESVVKEYRDRQVPLDCIILDWRSWAGTLWGEKIFDKERFPNPTAMMDNIHKMNGRLMISIWPCPCEPGENHAEFKAHGLLLGNQTNYNVFDDKALKIYWEQTERGLFCHGIDAWWCDCTEPFNADWNGSAKLNPFQRAIINVEEAQKYVDQTLINGYSLRHSQGLYEGQRNNGSSKRVVNLTRSASMGQCRYGTISWSGDIEARWSRLRKQIADGLNYTITGDPRWTFDIGAFFVKPSVQWFWNGEYPEGNQDLGYRELYTRWLQVGVFMPHFRSHGTDTSREIWNFGEKGTLFYEAIKENIELRYKLMPYIYSLAGQEVHCNYTTLRNLAFDFRKDSKVHNIADQFMFGPAIMVCPVLNAQLYGPNSTKLEHSVQSRSVYLPQGCGWYDFYTNRYYNGGQTIEVATPLERIPLFVKAGSIIPIGPVMQYVDEEPNAEWTINVYSGCNCEFDIYEDAGDTYDYEQGEYSWRKISWDETTQELTIAEAKGGFASKVADRKFKINKILPEI